MENQAPAQNSVTETPVSPTPPVPNPDSQPHIGSEEDKPKPRFSLGAIIGTIIFLLVAGGAAAGYVYREPLMKLVSQPKPTPTITVSPTPTPDPTADWETYIHPDGLYIVKFPREFSAVTYPVGQNSACKAEIVLKQKNNKQVTTLYTEGNIIIDVCKFGEQFFPDIIFSNITGSDLAEVEIGGKKGFSKQGVADLAKLNLEKEIKRTAVYLDGNSYSFDFVDDKNPQNLELFDQILSTFKFTDSNLSPTPIPGQTGPTCTPRPACLDATPSCMLPEPAQGWCPN